MQKSQKRGISHPDFKMAAKSFQYIPCYILIAYNLFTDLHFKYLELGLFLKKALRFKNLHKLFL